MAYRPAASVPAAFVAAVSVAAAELGTPLLLPASAAQIAP